MLARVSLNLDVILDVLLLGGLRSLLQLNPEHATMVPDYISYLAENMMPCITFLPLQGLTCNYYVGYLL